MKSKQLFNMIPVARPKSNRFDLSHDVKLSCQMGSLVPTLVMDCIPGDRVRIGCESLIRLAPMVAPMMHLCNVFMHYWFVPNRLVWPGWEDFIAPESDTAIAPAHPYVTINGNSALMSNAPLLNFMGIPTGNGANNENISAIPLAAYQKIYNDWYRDQNLQTANPQEQLIDGNNSASLGNLVQLQVRCWEHDYFTSCLPFAQKGQAVDIPFGNFEDVSVLAKEPPPNAGDTATVLTGTGVPSGLGDNVTVPYGTPVGSVSDLYAETSQMSNTVTTINALRIAESLQKLLEKFARGGSRYIEVVRNIFDVNSSDKRLQRPEYITGVKSAISISEVLQTSSTDTTSPQANMSGHGVGVVAGKYGSYFCEEHGYIIGIMSVLPKTAYQQGIARHWTRLNDRYDYFWPDLAHIGEQAVLNKEIYAFQGAASEEEFGYQSRWAEMKYMPSRVCGDFRDTLDHWHMGRIFSSAPALNAGFVQADPTLRVFADTDPGTSHLWCHVYHKIHASRKMPVFGTPRL